MRGEGIKLLDLGLMLCLEYMCVSCTPLEIQMEEIKLLDLRLMLWLQYLCVSCTPLEIQMGLFHKVIFPLLKIYASFCYKLLLCVHKLYYQNTILIA
jgi:hypothetical protein